jgi:hypothetical protein
MDTLEIIKELEVQKHRIEGAITALNGHPKLQRGGRRKMSAAARRRISLAQKKRWREQKKAKA